LASASAGRNKLAKIENKVDNITQTATSLHLTSLLTFYSTPQTQAAHALNSRIEWRLCKKKHGPVWAVAVRKWSQ